MSSLAQKHSHVTSLYVQWPSASHVDFKTHACGSGWVCRARRLREHDLELTERLM